MTELSFKPQIMGVMNITPDSFSDGGKLYSGTKASLSAAVDAASAMVNEGVDWLDVGGESTRPGAASVGLDEELARVIPVVEALRARFETRISVDTSQPEVITQAAHAGANMVNDVRALQVPGALDAAAHTDMAVCLMHMQGDPQTMQNRPRYDSVTAEVMAFLSDRVTAVIESGVSPSKISIDPGFGFGKKLEHNLELVNNISQFRALGYPVLVGFSRKSMLGLITGRDVDQRLVGTSALNLLALQNGASIVRVHDVAAAADILKIWSAISDHN